MDSKFEKELGDKAREIVRDTLRSLGVEMPPEGVKFTNEEDGVKFFYIIETVRHLLRAQNIGIDARDAIKIIRASMDAVERFTYEYSKTH